MRTLQGHRTLATIAVISIGAAAFALAQEISSGFEGFWGSQYTRDQR